MTRGPSTRVHNGRVSPGPAIVAVVLGLLARGAEGAVPGTAPEPEPEPERIAIEADTGGCPTRADVVAALNVRLPGAADGRRAPPAGRRLVLDQPQPDAGVRLRLIDARGAITLERRLGSNRRGRHDPVACAALAEAAAQLVARHLREIGYRPPALESPAPAPPSAPPETATGGESPAPPPPETATGGEAAAPPADAALSAAPPAESGPPAAVPVATIARSAAPPTPSRNASWLVVAGVATSGRLGVGAGDRWGRGELLLSLLARWRFLALALSGGASDERQVPIVGTEPGARLALRAYPLRASAGAAWRLSTHDLLVPSLGASVDWITFAASGVDQAASGRRADAALEGALAYLRALGPVAVGLRLAAGWALAPRDFDAGRSQPVFRTPAAYLRLELSAGFALGDL